MYLNRLSYAWVFVAYLCGITAACDNQNGREISSSATAELTPAGSVRIRSPTNVEEMAVEMATKRREAVDARFPGSAPPWGMPSERVVRLDAPGILQLEDDRKVRLDGIRCDERGVRYLRRVLFDTTVSVVVLPSDGSKITPIPADVWTVDTDLPQKGHASSRSYSNLIEGAITSGWCKVEQTATSRHNARNAALAKAFQGTGNIK